MNIQSISIVVPTKGCVNNCKFCVSKMHESPYENRDFDEMAYRKRIKYASMNGVNTLILTGTGEPLQNLKFLHSLQDILIKEGHPFPNVELQTTGVFLNDISEPEHIMFGAKQQYGYHNLNFLKALGVNTISLSVSDIFNSENNLKLIGVPKKLQFDLGELCKLIKDSGFNLRLSLNMTNVYDNKTPYDILKRCKELRADQITFRKLYGGAENTPEGDWVMENACDVTVIEEIETYIVGEKYRHKDNNEVQRFFGNGTPLYRLPFGPMAYSIMGMSTVVDDNCMSKDEMDKLKYVILRENGKLYCRWDDEGSLIF
jgi:hypothetical protein